ncbi:chemoreceptor glutamine deamidase CheD [Salinisphaera aquimarina]|uniref:Probable chemoreceptor glutamine deamidase CheD n=1 Tax=Salinisphaera aquimarina TaxID=2094031 RepID=A0ABV7EN95_9GAMM
MSVASNSILAGRDGSRHGLAAYEYFDCDHGCDAVKLLPGEYYATDQNMLLTTVLGSCVAACLRDPVAGVGGMNHFMLPAAGPDTLVDPRAAMRYGVHAMDALLAALYAGGARRERLEAKAFGGGMVLNDMKIARIGEANTDFLRRYLADRGIALVAEDLGDRCPRRVNYFPSSGRVLVRRFKRHDKDLAERELALARTLARAEAAARTSAAAVRHGQGVE